MQSRKKSRSTGNIRMFKLLNNRGGLYMKKRWITDSSGISVLQARSRGYRRTCENYTHNSAVFAKCPKRLLHGQRNEPVCSMRYGTYPMSYNGCEIIACYNAAVMLGKRVEFPRVVYEFELNRMHYIFPNGCWGTAPKKLWFFFDRYDMPYRAYRNGEAFASAAATKRPSCGIISFWNNDRSTAKFWGFDFFSGGLHTVAYRYKGGRFYLYNLFGRDRAVRTMSDISDAYRDKRFIIGYVFKGKLKNT